MALLAGIGCLSVDDFHHSLELLDPGANLFLRILVEVLGHIDEDILSGDGDVRIVTVLSSHEQRDFIALAVEGLDALRADVVPKGPLVLHIVVVLVSSSKTEGVGYGVVAVVFSLEVVVRREVFVGRAVAVIVHVLLVVALVKQVTQPLAGR